MRLCDIAVIVM